MASGNQLDGGLEEVANLASAKGVLVKIGLDLIEHLNASEQELQLALNRGLSF